MQHTAYGMSAVCRADRKLSVKSNFLLTQKFTPNNIYAGTNSYRNKRKWHCFSRPCNKVILVISPTKSETKGLSKKNIEIKQHQSTAKGKNKEDDILTQTRFFSTQ